MSLSTNRYRMSSGKVGSKGAKRARTNATTSSKVTTSYQNPNWKDTVYFGLQFPKKVIMKQKYVNKTTHSSGAGARVNTGYRMNGIYDPEVGVGDHQPLYFDQLMAVYNHYVVLAAKVTFEVFPYDGNLVPLTCVAFLNDDATVTPSFESTGEQSGAQIGTVDHSSPKKFTLYYSASRVFGPNPVANSNLRGSSTADPSEAYNAYICTEAADTVTAYNTAITTVIEYTVCYFELRDITGS